MAQVDFAQQMLDELQAVEFSPEFCKKWAEKWRALAVAAQAVLKVVFPAGAVVIGHLIAIADSFCGMHQGQ